MPPPDRPAVSVIMPFAGSADEGRAAVDELAGLALGDRDEAILVDNSGDGSVEARGGVRVVRAGRIASSYYARNTGAETAAGEWLLFADSDCRLPPTLIADYFAEPPAARTGLVAGAIEGDPAQNSLIARYHRSRGHLEPETPLATGPSPAVGTANALVRRAVWEELGGFAEVVSGADFEFSWRAGAAAWEVEHRPQARVLHRHPDELAATRRKARRYGAGQRWLDHRYPGVPRPPRLLRELARGAAGTVVWTLAIQSERARFKAIDAIWIAAYAHGWWRGDNTARPLAERS